MKNSNICMHWIKAPFGIEGNELADIMAKNAIIDGEYKPIILPGSILQKYKKEKINTEWQHYWKNIDKGRVTYKIINKTQNDLLFKINIINCFVTEHGSFPIYL